MASAPSDPKPIAGKVDSRGRLISADPELERLQVEAGSSVGASLAIPQLAAIVRVAQRLRVPLSRRVLAAGRDQDVDMWVRAVPEDDAVALWVDRWTVRSPSSPRLATIAAVEHEKFAPEPLTWSVDEHLRLREIAPSLADLLSSGDGEAKGTILTKLLRLEDGEGGEMPLLEALASRESFEGQRVRVRETGQQLVLSGAVTLGPGDSFAGFEGTAVVEGEGAPAKSRPSVDSAIQTALRSPLDRIVQSAEEMRTAGDVPVTEDYAAYASDIATAARHLLSVIRSLGEEGQSAGLSKIDLAGLVSEAVALVESAARERGIAIGVQPFAGLCAKGESRSIIQILVNLVGNAVRYSHPQTAVTISFERSGSAAMVHVADEGPGIDPADQDRIFQPFQKASEGDEGSGLGLAIARRLARAMGGDIQLHSAPGEGSRFTLVLPAA